MLTSVVGRLLCRGALGSRGADASSSASRLDALTLWQALARVSVVTDKRLVCVCVSRAVLICCPRLVACWPWPGRLLGARAECLVGVRLRVFWRVRGGRGATRAAPHFPSQRVRSDTLASVQSGQFLSVAIQGLLCFRGPPCLTAQLSRQRLGPLVLNSGPQLCAQLRGAVWPPGRGLAASFL